MNWYRLKFAADEAQGELFAEEDPKEQEEQKAATPDIRFIRGFTDVGAHFVVFRIGEKYYSYQMSFPDWVSKIRYWSKFSAGKALSWAKKKASKVFEVTEDYPQYGSIIREIKGE